MSLFDSFVVLNCTGTINDGSCLPNTGARDVCSFLPSV
jgi:hypothetical protein